MSREVFHPLGFHLLNLKVGSSHILTLFPALRAAGCAQPWLTGSGEQYESDSPGWCRHSFTPSANATTPYDPAKPSSGAQHGRELSGTGGYRINFCPDVGIYCRNLYRIFLLLGRAWDGHKGVLPRLLKLQEANCFQLTAAAQKDKDVALLGPLSMLCSQQQRWGDSALLFLRGFHAPQDFYSFPSLLSLLTSQKDRYLISTLITRPDEMSAANAQVFNCCWNGCRRQQSLRQGNHHSQQP